jgi:hypothetical protein
MKSILFAVLLYGSSAFAAQFWDYSCEFFKSGPTSDWYLFSGAINDYEKMLGWNAQTQTTHFYSTYPDDTQVGGCGQAFTYSPDNLMLAVYFVDGQGLDFAGRGCGFSGNSLKYSEFQSEKVEGDAHLTGTHDSYTKDGLRSEMIITGISSHKIPIENLLDHCRKIFEEDHGKPPANPLPGITESPFNMVEMWDGRRLVHNF